VDVRTGVPEAIFSLLERAHHVRRLADSFAHERDVVKRLVDYAAELDLKANELERDLGEIVVWAYVCVHARDAYASVGRRLCAPFGPRDACLLQ
jgi:hypothetical protein